MLKNNDQYFSNMAYINVNINLNSNMYFEYFVLNNSTLWYYEKFTSK